jgi:hypothetical protein
MKADIDKLIQDLKTKIDACGKVIRSSQYNDLSSISNETQFLHLAGLRAAIVRVAGAGSTYDQQAEAAQKSKDYMGKNLRKIHGIAQCCLADAQAGVLAQARELIHAETFADFLEMATHLLDEGYKDAAAVIAGSSLEMHLRNLARKNAIAVENDDGRPLKADRVNAELAKAEVYGKLDQKNITAWLDLRNKAAHGLYGEYSKEQVSLLCSAIGDFVTRNPA